jgi:hypothetical protein
LCMDGIYLIWVQAWTDFKSDDSPFRQARGAAAASAGPQQHPARLRALPPRTRRAVHQSNVGNTQGECYRTAGPPVGLAQSAAAASEGPHLRPARGQEPPPVSPHPGPSGVHCSIVGKANGGEACQGLTVLAGTGRRRCLSLQDLANAQRGQDLPHGARCAMEVGFKTRSYKRPNIQQKNL